MKGPCLTVVISEKRPRESVDRIFRNVRLIEMECAVLGGGGGGGEGRVNWRKKTRGAAATRFLRGR